MKTEHREQMGKQRAATLAIAAAAVLAGAAGTVACTDTVSTAINPCPCATGYVCCDSGVCAKDQSSCAAATQALSESVAGTWQGYVENFTIDGDSSLQLSIAVDAQGVLSGQVVLGSGSAPPPPTDFAAPWPPDLNADPLGDAFFFFPGVMSGFAYTAQNLRWEGTRLRFSLLRFEPWQSWCEAQHSYEDPPVGFYAGNFACAPGSSAGAYPDPVTGETICDVSYGCDVPPGQQCPPATPVACALAEVLCRPGGVCQCSASGCQFNPMGVAHFDVALRGSVGDGSVAGGLDPSDSLYSGSPESPIRNIRLMKSN